MLETAEKIDNIDENEVLEDAKQIIDENQDEPKVEAEEVVVTIGDEESPPQERAPEWVRELRKAHRELQKENRELHQKLQVVETKPTLPKKPALEDYDYDSDEYEKGLVQWFEQKRKFDEQNARAEAEAQNQQKDWQSKLESYANAKASLKVPDFDDSEDFVQGVLSVTQQGIVLQGAENPALVVYALGKNPKKAQELSQISDPVKFAFAVAKLEKDLKVTKKAPPAPEPVVQSTGRVSGSVDSTLERLREKAAKTGDFTEVVRYKSQKLRGK